MAAREVAKLKADLHILKVRLRREAPDDLVGAVAC
jgi:hypothetical protein